MKKDLWIRLRQYRFENLVPVSLSDRVKGAFGDTDAFTRAFAAKVARKHGWTDEFAFLAIREYKKFVFLGVTSHYEVTPSEVIDKVWHEHQLFTRGYREFCTNVLRQHFDHSPELIAFNTQTEIFNAQYQKTLDSYEHEFGSRPPSLIWGKTKFNPATLTGMFRARKKNKSFYVDDQSDSDVQLYTMFESRLDSVYAPIPVSISQQGEQAGDGGGSNSWSSSSQNDSGSSSSSGCSSSSGSSSSGCGGGGGE